MSFKMKKNDFEKTIQTLLSRAQSMKGAQARVFPLYQKLQTERFMSEGSSEGKQWHPLQPKYKAYKLRRYGGGPKRDGTNWQSFPGEGSKMLIATSTLAGSVIGRGSPFVSEGIQKQRVLFTKTSMEISIEESGVNAEGKPFDYPGYVNTSREFMKFSQKSIDQFKKEITKFILGAR